MRKDVSPGCNPVVGTKYRKCCFYNGLCQNPAQIEMLGPLGPSLQDSRSAGETDCHFVASIGLAVAKPALYVYRPPSASELAFGGNKLKIYAFYVYKII